MKKKLEIVDVIHRSLANLEDVRPLVKYLGMDEAVLKFDVGGGRDAATEIANYLRKMGSNDIAYMFRGGEGVPYEEVVLEVGEKLKAKVEKTNSVEKNEEQILLKMFEDALERMTDDEKRAVFRSMGMNEGDIPLGPIGAAVIQNLLREFGGFYIYQITIIVANMVSKALLGAGLSFATNAAITRTVGALLGPIGWIATGLWLIVDLAGPAYRKTVPAVIHLALLRTIVLNKITIGVVGDGSAGKDSLMKAVFRLDSKIDPIAGSTDTAVSYSLNKRGNAVIVNYPGFNDFRKSVDKYTDDHLHHTDVFVMVVDINRGISGTDAKILERIKSFGKPILICLNKVDLPRTQEDLAKLEQAALIRLHGYPLIKTAFDPDPRLHQSAIGGREGYDWIRDEIRKEGKNVDADYFPPPHMG
jgi:small GTP-binding protein